MNKANGPDLILFEKKQHDNTNLIGVAAPDLVRFREMEKKMKYQKLSKVI